MVGRLDGLEWVKVGSILFLAEGPRLIGELKERGLSVFLDLKWHDIPSTVAGAVKAAAALGVDMATVHALGGAAMMSAAAEVKAKMKLVAVTVLTSHDDASLAGAVGVGSAGGVLGEVERMAALAIRAGVDGVVCSAHEARAVVSALPGHPLIVVPGVRLGGDASGDQKRVADPRSASRAGATHVVVGRSITRSEDPQKVLLAVRAELEK